MKYKYLDGIAFVIVLIAIAVIAVILINRSSLELLAAERLNINSQEDYNINLLNEDVVANISLLPSSVFKLEETVDNKTYSIFSTNEYVFDFIIISENFPVEKTTLQCRDVTDIQLDLRNKLIAEFNNPVDVSSVLALEGIVLSEESTSSLSQNTTGRFGDATRLMDCTDGIVRSNLEIYFIIALEVMIVTSALLFIYRSRISKLLFDEEDNI